MLKIKLARFGKKHQAHYRIVVNEARDKRDGKYTALLGHYSPVMPKELQIDVKAYEEWIKKGAKATETVAALFKRFQSGKPFPVKKVGPSKKARKKAAEAANVKAEVKTEPTEPTVKEETPAAEKATESVASIATAHAAEAVEAVTKTKIEEIPQA